MILVSVRLGMNQIPNDYFPAIRAFFENRLNVGVIGGRPKEAFYLVGIQGEHMIYLDPHTTLDAVPFDMKLIQESYLTYHETQAKKIHFSKLDPCMTLGFLLKSQGDFEEFQTFIKVSKERFGENSLFGHMETKPDYAKSGSPSK